MSTATIPEEKRGQAGSPPPDLRIYSHSPILYWWPVWAVGLVMALWTYLDGSHMVLAPEGFAVVDGRLELPPGGEAVAVGVHVARSRIPGVVFVVTLLVEAVLSQAYLRGAWSLVIGVSVLAAAFLLGWLDLLQPLWRWMSLMSVYINLGGYLVLSTALFVVWALHVFILDRRLYLIVSMGQIRLRDELGDEEKVFDAGSVTFEKRPYDLFRWLVGIGAGDLVLRAGGPQGQHIELPNVVGVGACLHKVEQLLRMRDVV